MKETLILIGVSMAASLVYEKLKCAVGIEGKLAARRNRIFHEEVSKTSSSK